MTHHAIFSRIVAPWDVIGFPAAASGYHVRSGVLPKEGKEESYRDLYGSLRLGGSPIAGFYIGEHFSGCNWTWYACMATP